MLQCPKQTMRLTFMYTPGRQLFERDRNLGTLDEGLNEEDAVSVDISQYDRTAMEDEDNDEDHVTFSDSD